MMRSEMKMKQQYLNVLFIFKNIDQTLKSQKVPHISPSPASYEMFIVVN